MLFASLSLSLSLFPPLSSNNMHFFFSRDWMRHDNQLCGMLFLVLTGQTVGSGDGSDVYADLYSQGAVNPLATNYIHVSAEEPPAPTSGDGEDSG